MNEKAKEFLNKYKQNIEKLQILEEERAELYSLLDVGSIPFESDGSAKGSSDIHKREHIHSKLADIDADIEKEKIERMTTLHRIESKIRKLPKEEETKVLHYRYIKLMKWEQIAVKMGYSYMHVHRIHSDALINLTNML